MAPAWMTGTVSDTSSDLVTVAGSREPMRSRMFPTISVRMPFSRSKTRASRGEEHLAPRVERNAKPRRSQAFRCEHVLANVRRPVRRLGLMTNDQQGRACSRSAGRRALSIPRAVRPARRRPTPRIRRARRPRAERGSERADPRSGPAPVRSDRRCENRCPRRCRPSL